MRNFLIVTTLLLLLTGITAEAQWRSKTHDLYEALRASSDIEIDGELNDDEGWEGALETVKGTNGKPFCEVEFEGVGGAVKVFETHGGGTWKDANDHKTCFAIFWEPEALYIGIKVTDDEHEHGAGQAWNGDGAQLSFVPSGNRAGGQPDILYNAGLHDNGNLILGNERTRGNPGLVAGEGESIFIVRNEGEKETYYEFKITPENLGLKEPFSEGYEFGLGICINDGDKAAGQGGQKGWSGWYPHSVVHGKNPEKTGLVRLIDETLAVEAANKLATTWGKLKSIR